MHIFSLILWEEHLQDDDQSIEEFQIQVFVHLFRSFPDPHVFSPHHPRPRWKARVHVTRLYDDLHLLPPNVKGFHLLIPDQN